MQNPLTAKVLPDYTGVVRPWGDGGSGSYAVS
jgi:hypothetical protein